MFRVFLRIGGTFLVEMGIFVLNCKRLEHLVMRPILTSNTSRGLFEQLCCEYWCMVYTWFTHGLHTFLGRASVGCEVDTGLGLEVSLTKQSLERIGERTLEL